MGTHRFMGTQIGSHPAFSMGSGLGKPELAVHLGIKDSGQFSQLGWLSGMIATTLYWYTHCIKGGQ